MEVICSRSAMKETTGLLFDHRACADLPAVFTDAAAVISLCINTTDRSAPDVAPGETGLTEPRR